ncbi:MAG: type 1 glutamine amidotransferase [bacterium]|jgi:GMP synthase-like glutamine amidotransferase|nr:type 1 glutamine amidotransferase [bacterium]
MIQKPVLFLKNITLEGPGTFEHFLWERNIPYVTQDLYGGEMVPDEVGDFGALVVLGGPMNIYEEDAYPFLRAEKRFLRQALEREVPMLGICLGAQLVADVLGGPVTQNELPEIGWMDVHLTPEGEKSRLFEGIPNRMPVFQWHGDTFAVPPGCAWLASSPLCPHQAFSYEERVFGLQFHVEVDTAAVAAWAGAYLPELEPAVRPFAQALLDSQDGESAGEVEAIAKRLCRNFFGRIAGYF